MDFSLVAIWHHMGLIPKILVVGMLLLSVYILFRNRAGLRPAHALLAGTALGIVVSTFLFTFFVGTVKSVWASGQWGELISREVFLSLGLLVFSFFIPGIVEKVRNSGRMGGTRASR